MTKTRVSSTTWVFTAAWIVLLSGSQGPAGDPFLDGLTRRFKQYQADYREEKTYLLTDRYVYKPGEDLWFKGFVLATGEEPNAPGSEDFFVKLINSKGEEIISRRYPININYTAGHLLIPRSLIPGRYKIIAYTGWMKNQCPAQAFSKELLISKYFDKRFQVEASYDKAYYFTGDTLKANIRILDQNDKPVPVTAFNFTLGSFERSVIKGSGITDASGRADLECVIPHPEEILIVTIEIRSRKLSGEYTLIVPACSVAPEIAFYPEGGHLVKGVSATVAIKAFNRYGLPTSIEGSVIDRSGKVLHAVSTNPDGLGKFEFLPQADTCYLQIARPSGINRRYPLPMARDNGWSLHCAQQGPDTAIFRITASGEQMNQTSYWVFSMHNRILDTRKVAFRQTADVHLPVNNMGNGMLQVSVFDETHALAAERLIYVTHPGEPLRVLTDHHTYRSRQRVNLLVELTGSGNHAHVAMVVGLRNLSRNPISPDLNRAAGFIPCDTLPDPTFTKDLISELDLLTTRYRDISWDKVLRDSGQEDKFRSQNGLSGKVYDKKDNLSQHAKVRVTHVTNYRTYETQTDETGTFQVLFGSDIIDLNSLNVDAYDALGKVSLSAAIDQAYSDELRRQLTGTDENNDIQKVWDVISYGEPDLIYALRYGPGKFRKTTSETRKKYDPRQYTGYNNVLDIIQEIKPYKVVNNAIVFTETAGNIPGPMANEGAIIVINGALKGNKMDILKKLLPSDITNINISTSQLDVHKYTPLSFQGVIEITTIQGMYRYRQPMVQLGMDILSTNRSFYSPDYSIESTNTSDNRKTLFWKPDIKLESGKSNVFSFYTSDVKGTYYGLVEGLDKEGKPVRCEFSFTVE
jgi:hypothetical protein